MKEIKRILVVVIYAVALTSCIQQLEDLQPFGTQMTFTAQFAESGNDTKTVLNPGDGKVLWGSADSINVFRAGDGGKFVSTNTEPSRVVEFTGSLSAVAGSQENSSFWAVYPYASGNTSDGASVTFVQACEQQAVAGSFDPLAFPTLACSNSPSLAFYNVCGGIKFSVQREGITQVILRGNQGETLAGRVTARMNKEGLPEVIRVDEAKDYVKLSAPAGESFRVGEWYYLVCLPVEFSKGFTLGFKAILQAGEYFYDGTISVKRSIWGRLENVDEGLVFGEDIGDELVPPDNEIWYISKDNTIIDYLGKSIDTMYDDIGLNGKPFDVNITEHFFDGTKCIIRCDGPITKVNNRCFSIDYPKQSKITSITLPNSVKEIGRYCFNMADITEFRFPDDLQVCGNPFCNNPRLTKFLGKHTDGHSLILNGVLCTYTVGSKDESYVIPDGVTEIGYGAFDCARFSYITIPNTVKRIGYAAFQRSSLKWVTIPESVEEMESNAFDVCMSMKGIYGNPKFCTEDHFCFKLYSEYYGGDFICAFFGQDLTSYSIPEGIAGIGGMSFYSGGQNLEAVTLPESIQVIDAYAFKDCRNLKYLYGAYTTDDHRGYIRDGKLQVLLSRGLTEYKTTPDVTAIADNLFEYNNTLERIIISDEVTKIGYDCFANCDKLKTIVLSCNLKNFPFYCFKRSYNVENIYIRSKVPPSVDDWTCPGSFFPEKEYEKLSIYVPQESLSFYLADTRWSRFSPYLKGFDYQDLPDTDFYLSSDYSYDSTVTTLQQSSIGAGIDLILMGDAFSDRQIADGTYGNVMQKTMDAFFSEEPYKTMKDCFNIYIVNVVSATEGYEHSGQALSTGHGDGTNVFGNNNKVIEYATKAIGENRLDDAVIVVVMNENAYAGTCYMYEAPDGDYGRGTSIAYFPMNSNNDTFNGIVLHEAAGHGFAKLGDEYAYQQKGTIPQSVIDENRKEFAWGWSKNVDFTSDPSQVKWSLFLADERYASENLGCYEGGLTYWSGVWRPTEDSIMNHNTDNTGGFNAPSRYAIWYRINKLAYGEDWNGTYEDFVAYDAVNRTPTAAARRKAQHRSYVEKRLPPLAPPVVVGHSWRDAQ